MYEKKCRPTPDERNLIIPLNLLLILAGILGIGNVYLY